MVRICTAALVALVASSPHVSFCADEPLPAAQVAEVASADAVRALDAAVTHVRLGEGGGDAVVAELGRLRKLVSLSAADRPVTDAGLRGLAALAALREIDLSRCSAVTSAGVKALGGLKKLEVVRLAGDAALDDAAILALGKLPHLRVVDLSGCTHLTDESVKALRELEEIQELSLVDVKLTLRGTQNLARLQSLRVLRLDRTGIPDEAMLHVVGLRKLEELSVSGNPDFGWIGLLHLDGLRKLRVLDASGLPNISDEALQRASKMATLESLNVSDCARLTDAGIGALAASPSLQTLDISRTNVTVKAVFAFAQAKRLTKLRIAACPHLGAPDVEAARKAMPAVAIETD